MKGRRSWTFGCIELWEKSKWFIPCRYSYLAIVVVFGFGHVYVCVYKGIGSIVTTHGIGNRQIFGNFNYHCYCLLCVNAAVEYLKPSCAQTVGRECEEVIERDDCWLDVSKLCVVRKENVGS